MSTGAAVNQSVAVISARDAGKTVMASELANVQVGLELSWMILCTFLVISMQLGFAMLEVGSVRHAHRMTVLVKNVMDSVVSCIALWLCIQCGDNRMVQDAQGNVAPYHLMWQWAFCATSVTVCSGTMAERTNVLAYICFAAVMSGIIYPKIATSMWFSGGVFHNDFHGRFHHGYDHHDFAGGGVVHVSGGCAALLGSILVGRRIVAPSTVQTFPTKEATESSAEGPPLPLYIPGQSSGAAGEWGPKPRPTGDTFGDLEDLDEWLSHMAKPSEGWTRRFDSPYHDLFEFRPCAYLQVMGTFTLWIGWYGFNAGSTGCMDRECGMTAARVAWNTTLSACAGGFGAYVNCFCFMPNLPVSFLCNGVLGGLVAITAACDLATDYVAVMTGFAAGLVVFPLASKLMQKARLDDPLDAVSVHLACGMFGLLVCSSFRPDCDRWSGRGFSEVDRFCLKDFSVTKQLLAQAWGAFTEIWFTTSILAAMWFIFVISELTRSQEATCFDDADVLLAQMVSGASSEDPAVLTEQWAAVAAESPAARKVLRRQGWDSRAGCFRGPGGAPYDVWALRLELRQARGEKTETALEIAPCWPLQRLARYLHRCQSLREILFLRMRIAPVSEIRGVGSADLDGGELYKGLHSLISQLSETQREQSPLKTEVRELALAVQSQESVLNAMVRRGNGRGSSFWRRRHKPPDISPVPELSDSSPTHVNLLRDTEGFHSHDASPSVTAVVGSTRPAHIVQGGSQNFGGTPAGNVYHGLERSATSSDVTVSDKSAGAISPTSISEENTPPPSTIGRHTQRGRVRERGGDAEAQRVDDVADQLVSLLNAQTALLANLQNITSTGGATIGNPAQAAGTGSPANTTLISALQQMAANSSGGSAQRSSSSTSI